MHLHSAEVLGALPPVTGTGAIDNLLEPPPRLRAQQLRPETPFPFSSFACLLLCSICTASPLMAMATHDHWVRGAQALDVRVELTILV